MNRNDLLRKLMARHKLDQVQAARLIRVDKSAVNHWVNDNRECPAMALELLAMKLGDGGEYECCGLAFPDALGAYGCPNCLGERRAKRAERE